MQSHTASDNDIMSPEEKALLRAELMAQAAAELQKPPRTAASVRGSRVKGSSPAPRTPKALAKVNGGGPVNANSIRQHIIQGLIAGETTEQLTAMLQEKFPQAKAASKASIHIAFYRSKLRKAGLLPKAVRGKRS